MCKLKHTLEGDDFINFEIHYKAVIRPGYRCTWRSKICKIGGGLEGGQSGGSQSGGGKSGGGQFGCGQSGCGGSDGSQL